MFKTLLRYLVGSLFGFSFTETVSDDRAMMNGPFGTRPIDQPEQHFLDDEAGQRLIQNSLMRFRDQDRIREALKMIQREYPGAKRVSIKKVAKLLFRSVSRASRARAYNKMRAQRLVHRRDPRNKRFALIASGAFA